MRAGDNRGGIVAIVSGSVAVRFLVGHPDTAAVHIAHAGFCAGYKTLLGQARHLTIVARTQVTWALFPQIKVEELLTANPRWWRDICLLANELAEASAGAFADLTRLSSFQRTVAVLLRVADCRYADSHHSGDISINASQQDLAAMCAMSRNTFNTNLAKLVEMGLIAHGYRTIQLIDSQAMRDLLERDG